MIFGLLWAYSLLLLCLCITILLSPVIIQYEKDEAAALRLHFVFFSLSFSRREETKKEKAEDGKRREKKSNGKGGRASARALLAALQRALPHSTLHIRTLPLIEGESPFRTAMLTGVYFFLISLFVSRFGGCTDRPLLKESKNRSAPLNLQIKIRFCVFLYTFLVCLAQYKKEKEAKSNGRNENERYYTNLS